MTDKREIIRAEARGLRVLAKDQSRQNAKLTQERMVNAMRTARVIVVDESFVEMLRGQDIQSLPQLLVTKANPNKESEGEFHDHSLDFVIAWTFFFPLFANPVIATYLEQSWPGFTIELKDAFISVVVDGPLSRAST